jgi:hypothetical protein
MPLGSAPHVLRLLAALLALVPGVGIALALTSGHSAKIPAYTVAELQAALAGSPASWAGRTVRVRGTILADCHSLDTRPAVPCGANLTDSAGASLPLAPRWHLDPLLAALRRLPFVGPLVRSAQVVRAGRPSTYRVQLQIAPAATCSAQRCYEALPLDTAPDSP